MRISALIAAPVVALGFAAVPAFAVDAPSVDKSATLPAIALGAFQSTIPDVVEGTDTPGDRGVLLGGIGSGLYKVNKTDYWTITDRGPNGEPEPPGNMRTFIVPEFTPTLVKVRVRGTSLQVLDSVPLVTSTGTGVTGLPPFVPAGDPTPGYIDASTDRDGDLALDLVNPNGMDTEGVVATADGFWVVDEYGPSIAKVSLEGVVTDRYVPVGSEGNFAGADATIHPVLPAELASRTGNRGFEDVALLPDGHTLVVALQSDLDLDGNKDADTLTTRLLTFDTTLESVVDYYRYTFDDNLTFKRDAVKDARVKDLKISALVPMGGTKVLVQERTDVECRFYIVDLGADLDLAGADKTLLVNLKGVAGIPGKVEGAAFKSRDTLALISDNDFGFNVDPDPAYTFTDIVQQTGVPTTYVEVKLP